MFRKERWVMGCRYQRPTDRESEVSFRVVEILVVGQNRAEKKNRFLMVDNGQETLEMVQKEMQDFVKTAIMANRLGKPENSIVSSRNL
ncbi:MAG TPA: hypothetical protein VN652_00875 [Geobacteraceae bacterium]|nr:hypothetical protein [Geobacteraceae bacterium]